MPIPNEGDEDVLLEDLPVVNDGEEDKTDWKAEAIKRDGIARRFKTKANKLKEELESSKEKPNDGGAKSKQDDGKKDGLDRIDKAVLRAEKITESDELELVESIMKETGKDVEGVLASKYFQSELKELREAKATKDAMPDGTKRTGSASRDSVDYWLAKGELPPHDQPELRQKVVNAKINKQKNQGMFSSNPIS